MNPQQAQLVSLATALRWTFEGLCLRPAKKVESKEVPRPKYPIAKYKPDKELKK